MLSMKRELIVISLPCQRDHEMKPSHSSRNATIGSTLVARRAGR